MRTIFILFIISCINVHFGQAQQATVPALERRITIHAENQPIETLLADISNQAGFVFSYSPEAINARNKATIHASNKPVKLVLNNLFDDEVDYKTKGKYVILKKTSPSKNTEKQTIEGYITDNSGEIVTDASIYSKDVLVSTVTDQYGYFKMEVPVNKRLPSIYVSKIGYSDTLLASRLSLQQKQMIEISLGHQDTAVAKRKSSLSFQKFVPSWLIPKKIQIHSLNMGDSIFRSVQVSLLPLVTTNYFLTGNVENKFSFNATIGYVYGIRVVELGGMLNIVRTNARYCQLAGIGNIVGGNFTGFQGAGILNYARSVKGVQAAGVINTARENADIQLSGVINQAHSSKIQAAGVVNLASDAKIQLSGVVNTALKSNILQVAGVTNAALSTNTQLSGIVNIADTCKMLQVAGAVNIASVNNVGQLSGFINLAGTANTQVSGFINIAHHLKGLQLSVINISDTCSGIPIGLFNYVKRGYHKLEISYEETSKAALAFRTGSQLFHTIFDAGIYTNRSDKGLWSYGYGIGTSLGKAGKMLFDIDLSVNQLFSQNDYSFNNNLCRMYLGIDRKIASKLSIAAGLTFNFLSCDANSPYFTDVYSKIPSYTLINKTNSNGINHKTWIGAKIAIRLF